MSWLILGEGMVTRRALLELLSLVRLLVINHVAEFWSLNRAL